MSRYNTIRASHAGHVYVRGCCCHLYYYSVLTNNNEFFNSSKKKIADSRKLNNRAIFFHCSVCVFFCFYLYSY